MIRLSKLSDYAVVLMVQLASQGGGPLAARELAEATGLPLPAVSKVLKSLAREGLLLSLRGSKGGYSLARPAGEISAAAMIAALEGPIGLTQCTAEPGECSQEASCHLREPWHRINSVVGRALADVSLADLAAPAGLAAQLERDTIPLARGLAR